MYDNSVPESNALIFGAWKFCNFADQIWNPSKSNFTFDLQNSKIFMLQKFYDITLGYWIILQSWLFIYCKPYLPIMLFDTKE